MKVLIIYGTLSGSTMTAAQIASDAITSHGCETELVAADPSVKDLIAPHQAVVFASPSWEDQGKDGQPLPEIRQLIESLDSGALAGKKVALLGLGDENYEHFCGAVNVMEELLKEKGVAEFAVPHLKIDRYYSSPDNEQKVKDWAQELAKIIL